MRKREKSEKGEKRINFLLILIILILLAALGVVAYKGFTVKQVQVEGTDLYPDETIRQWVLNDDYSWNTLYVFLKYKFKDAEEMPFLQQPEVRIKGPHSLSIKVREKKIAGYLYVPAMGQNAYFNKDGVVVETSSRKLEGMMEVTGLECSKVSPQTIHCDEYSNIMLEYEKVTVNMGNSQNLSTKMETLSVIFPQLKDMSGTLHMENWSEENTDVPFEKSNGS